MGDNKSFVYLDADRYEDLVSRSTHLFMLEKAYEELTSYRFDDFVKALFGEQTGSPNE